MHDTHRTRRLTGDPQGPGGKLSLRRCAALLALLGTAGLIASCSDDDPERPDTRPPEIAITAPLDGDTLLADPQLIEAAADDDRGVARVEFYAGGTLLGTDPEVPYTYAWSWGDLGNDGVHELRATAVDQAGNTASDTIRVFLPQSEPPDTVPPVVAIVAPLAGGEVTGQVTIAATATDTGVEGAGIAAVTFYVDGALLGADGESPYEHLWDTRTLATGQQYALSAIAADLAGNTAADTVRVTVVADEQAPEVAITTPAGSALAATEAITATATDAGGVAVVRFYLDDVLAGVDRAAPFEQPALALLYWADGTSHVVAVEAEDFAGNRRRSEPVAVTIIRPATAWLSQVLAVAGPGEADGHRFARLVRLNPQVRYRGSQIDTIDVNTCIQGNSALVDYELTGCLFVLPAPLPDTTRFHIDHCILINAVNRARTPPPGSTISWGGAIEFVSMVPSREAPCGQVTHCTIYNALQSGIYLHRSQAERIVIKNNLFVQNQLGGCVRYADDVTATIRYNCAFQNNHAQFGEHCGCPSALQPTEIYITDPEEQLGTNIIANPDFPAITKPPFDRRLREHFVLGPETPCRYSGEDGTYLGAMPPAGF